jgi:hypothetical protein
MGQKLKIKSEEKKHRMKRQGRSIWILTFHHEFETFSIARIRPMMRWFSVFTKAKLRQCLVVVHHPPPSIASKNPVREKLLNQSLIHLHSPFFMVPRYISTNDHLKLIARTLHSRKPFFYHILC